MSTKTYWRVCGASLTKIAVFRETTHTLVIRVPSSVYADRLVERRINKASKYEKIFPTWHQAYAYLLGKVEAAAFTAQRKADSINKLLEELRDMEEPIDENAPQD